MEQYFDQFIAFFIAGTPKLFSALVIFVLSLYFARLISNLLRTRTSKTNERRPALSNSLGNWRSGPLFVAGVITALQQFVDVTAFLTGLGILGFYGWLCACRTS